jgi:low temperature requirement protein LtrA
MARVTTAGASPRSPRINPVMRDDARVTPLELFFDLVFVLALTQCTALMADQPSWGGIARGLLILGVLWWAWVGYAWLTSVINPDEGAVRIAMFVAMAGLLIVSLCVPDAFEDLGLLFAGAYAVVRYGQLALFMLAARDDPDLTKSVTGLAVSSTIGVAILAGASFADGWLQGALWALAIVLDMGGPFFFGSEGWKLEPSHFAERHGLILIIALGESIVAIGIGAGVDVDAAIVIAACVGIAIAAATWWLYFDVVALVAERRLTQAEPGREQNDVARDSYSYLHLPMVAGIVLMALGMKKTLEHTDEPLKLEIATALLGGAAIYLLAHVAFRYRTVHRVNFARISTAVIAVALIPVAKEIDSLYTLTILAVLLAGLIVYEVNRYAELRDRMRHEVAREMHAHEHG